MELDIGVEIERTNIDRTRLAPAEDVVQTFERGGQPNTVEPGKATAEVAPPLPVEDLPLDAAPEAADDDIDSSTQVRAGDEYVVDRITDQAHADDGSEGHWVVKIKWHGFPASQCTSKPLENMRSSQVIRYYRRKRIDHPPNLNEARHP